MEGVDNTDLVKVLPEVKTPTVTAEQLWDLMAIALDSLAFAGGDQFFKLDSKARTGLLCTIADVNKGSLPYRIECRFNRGEKKV